MGLTAYLPPSLLSRLSDVEVAPGSSQNGYPLTWNNTLGKWVASLLPISSLTGGPLPVLQGGTGSNTGSITGTGAITFAAGGTNHNISLVPSGTGAVVSSRTVITHSGSGGAALSITGPAASGTAQFAVYSNQPGEVGFSLWGNDGTRRIMFLGYSDAAFFACEVPIVLQGVQVNSSGTAEVLSPSATYVPIEFVARYQNPVNGDYAIAGNSVIFRIQNRFTACLLMYGNGDTHFLSATESTSTSTGAVHINGGLGVAKSLYVGSAAGGKVNFANLPTASSGLNSGDLWRDSNGFLRIV